MGIVDQEHLEDPFGNHGATVSVAWLLLAVNDVNSLSCFALDQSVIVCLYILEFIFMHSCGSVSPSPSKPHRPSQVNKNSKLNCIFSNHMNVYIYSQYKKVRIWRLFSNQTKSPLWHLTFSLHS